MVLHWVVVMAVVGVRHSRGFAVGLAKALVGSIIISRVTAGQAGGSLWMVVPFVQTQVPRHRVLVHISTQLASKQSPVTEKSVESISSLLSLSHRYVRIEEDRHLKFPHRYVDMTWVSLMIGLWTTSAPQSLLYLYDFHACSRSHALRTKLS